jgi:hypothetical protein
MFKHLAISLLLGVYGMSSCCLGAAASADDNSGARRFNRQFKSLEIVADSSQVRLTSVDSPYSDVSYNVVGAPASQRITISENGDTLKVEAKKLDSFIDSRVDFNITTRDTESILIKIGCGSADIRGLSSSTKMTFGQGNIELNAPLSNLEVAVGQGSLIAENLHGDVAVDIGQGKGEIKFCDIPVNRRSINIKSGQGDFEVKIPEKASVEWSPQHPQGMFSIFSDFRNTPAALYKISAKFGMGRLRISKI